MLTLSEFRARVPQLAQSVYLNNCSQGALSADVDAAMGAYLESWRRHGSPWDSWLEKVEQLRSAFAASIGADPDEIAVVPSASAGINAVASAISFAGERQNVVMGDLEFPTMGHVWLARQRRGARVVWVRSTAGRLDAEAYDHAVDEATAIVPVTHVCFRNGWRMDIAALTALCHERGAYILVDDYQRTGTGPIDVHQLGIDFLVTGCLKYLLGPAGVAFLYVRAKLIDRLEPVVTGWFGRVNPFEYRADRLDWSPTARRFETGTPPIPNVFGALAGLGLLEQVGLMAIESRIAALARQMAARARSAGWAVLTPAESAVRGPLVVVASHDAPTLAARLAGRGVIVSARGQGVRFAFHGYNNEDDVQAACAALEAESALIVRDTAGTGTVPA